MKQALLKIPLPLVAGLYTILDHQGFDQADFSRALDSSSSIVRNRFVPCLASMPSMTNLLRLDNQKKDFVWGGNELKPIFATEILQSRWKIQNGSHKAVVPIRPYVVRKCH